MIKKSLDHATFKQNLLTGKDLMAKKSMHHEEHKKHSPKEHEHHHPHHKKIAAHLEKAHALLNKMHHKAK